MEPRTAKPHQSIWCKINENKFRQHVVALAKLTNEVPKDPKTYSTPIVRDAQDYFELECTLAQDFSFMAAAEEGVHSVSAACVEGLNDSGNLTIRLASNSGVNARVKSAFETIVKTLERCAKDGW